MEKFNVQIVMVTIHAHQKTNKKTKKLVAHKMLLVFRHIKFKELVIGHKGDDIIAKGR